MKVQWAKFRRTAGVFSDDWHLRDTTDIGYALESQRPGDEWNKCRPYPLFSVTSAHASLRPRLQVSSLWWRPFLFLFFLSGVPSFFPFYRLESDVFSSCSVRSVPPIRVLLPDLVCDRNGQVHSFIRRLIRIINRTAGSKRWSPSSRLEIGCTSQFFVPARLGTGPPRFP